MNKVYIILQHDLRENRTSVYDVYLDKNLAKRDVYNVEEQETNYTIEAHFIHTKESEDGI